MFFFFSFTSIYLVNGKIKEWNYFNCLQNSSLRFLPDDLDIVCAVHNAFRRPAMKDSANGLELAKIMLEQTKKENELEKRLIQISNDENMHWKKYDSRMCIFPSLTEEDVRNICCGKTSLPYRILTRIILQEITKLSNQNLILMSIFNLPTLMKMILKSWLNCVISKLIYFESDFIHVIVTSSII